MDERIQYIVERFELIPHPEGGYFREIYRSELEVPHPGIPVERGRTRRAGTLIYFLLCGDDFSAFHRVRWTDEIWHLYAGGPLELHRIDGLGRHSKALLTTDLHSGEPTRLVPAGEWQAARLAKQVPWAFGGCTVAPGFEFDDFEMPPAAPLLEQFPQHRGIILELTRTQPQPKGT